MIQGLKELCSNYLRKVKQTGDSYIMACCPFHDEEHPSFAINLDLGFFLCHACQERGGLRKLLKQLGISDVHIEKEFQFFIDAAEKAWQTALPKDPRINQIGKQEPLPEALLGFFNYCPVDLEEAGFTEKTLKHFEVGVDEYHRRITFPLRDMYGHLVGISGRAVDKNVYSRYKVYDDEYVHFGLPKRNTIKKEILWHSHEVFPALHLSKTKKDLIITEGYKACMWVWQLGFQNVVAISGSSLSEEHAYVIERLGVRTFLLLDNNKAGRKGTDIAAQLLAKSSTDVFLPNYDLVCPDKEQPDQLTQLELQSLLTTAIPYYLWRTQHVRTYSYPRKS